MFSLHSCSVSYWTLVIINIRQGNSAVINIFPMRLSHLQFIDEKSGICRRINLNEYNKCAEESKSSVRLRRGRLAFGTDSLRRQERSADHAQKADDIL